MSLGMKKIFLPFMVAFLAGGFAHAETVSLLHFDGANGSTTFTDAIGNAWTASGNVQVSSTAAVSGQSVYFDGSGGDLRVNNASLFNFGSASFTIDFWIKLNNEGHNTYLLGRSNANGGQGFDLRLDLGEICVVRPAVSEFVTSR